MHYAKELTALTVKINLEEKFMKNKIILAGILVIILVSGCTQLEPVKNNGAADNQNRTKDNSDNGSAPKTFSLSEIAKHNNADDCWLVLSGKVFDVTEFIPSHPGGTAILEGCGKDATELFENRSMGSGTPHSDNARTLRENYFIGNLQ
ncbi:MAG: cytochrome B5 [Candidatus Diapherotrites archaeon CG10_big_fil_rev_8_21_14_0_10_31_34]|nr:MAG: cytochrome B5 [Candidatus Diapherotrites archaeon CG10_big_fil_rev_8_21_14_0_10_31_34]